MTEYENPPAFPCGTDVTLNQCAPSVGMTLLDHFAGLAMQGVMANPDFDMNAPMPAVALTVYKMADAMLKERQSWIK